MDVSRALRPPSELGATILRLLGRLRWLALLFAIVSLFLFAVPKVAWLRVNIPELSILALALVTTAVVIPEWATWAGKRPLLLRAVTICLIAFAGVGFWFGAQDKAKYQGESRDLAIPLANQATPQDFHSLSATIQTLDGEMRDFIANSKIAADNMLAAIQSLKSAPPKTSKGAKPPSKVTPPDTGPTAPANTGSTGNEATAAQTPPNVVRSLGPSVVQHAHWAQRRTTSKRDDAPFAIQLVIQSDAPSQPTAFMIETSGEMVDGEFFIAGESVMMGVGYGVQPDKKHFYLRFEYPAFKPESPIVVTIYSKSDIAITSVSPARP